MFSASRHRQVKRNAPRILLISNESIAASGSWKAGNSSESGAGAALDGETHSRFAGALATRITASGAERNEPGKPAISMTSDVLILTPARMASTRLPDKPLADIAGVPMIV